MKEALDIYKEYPFHFFNPIYPAQSFHLHSMLINNGHQAVSAPPYCFDGMKRGNKDFFIWQYTLAGCGRLRFEGEEYKIDQGKAMLLLVPEKHCYYFSPDDKYWEFIFITINGSELIRLWLELRKMTGPVVSVPPGSKCLYKAAEIYRACCEGQLQDSCEASAMAYDFTMHALQELGKREGKNSTPDFIPKITDYCMKHIGEDITVNDMCRISGYSKFHFSRLFHQYQGTSPKVFVTNLKMRLAIRLLQTERLSIKEIAAKCGFMDASYFCKVFRSYHSVSPACFRNQQ